MIKKFRWLWERILDWSEHRYAHVLLCVVSFFDSCVSPVSPWFMLVPMCLSKPEKAWRYVFTCSFFGMLGAMVGYSLGHYLITVLTPWLHDWGYWEAYSKVVDGLEHWGLWMLWIAALLPLPYKFFAIGSGFIGLSFLPFTLISLCVRWIHFAIIPVVFLWGALPFLKRFCHLSPRSAS